MPSQCPSAQMKRACKPTGEAVWTPPVGGRSLVLQILISAPTFRTPEFCPTSANLSLSGFGVINLSQPKAALRKRFRKKSVIVACILQKYWKKKFAVLRSSTWLALLRLIFCRNWGAHLLEKTPFWCRRTF